MPSKSLIRVVGLIMQYSMILIPLQLVFSLQYCSNRRKKHDFLNDSVSELDDLTSNRVNNFSLGGFQVKNKNSNKLSHPLTSDE